MWSKTNFKPIFSWAKLVKFYFYYQGASNNNSSVYFGTLWPYWIGFSSSSQSQVNQKSWNYFIPSAYLWKWSSLRKDVQEQFFGSFYATFWGRVLCITHLDSMDSNNWIFMNIPKYLKIFKIMEYLEIFPHFNFNFKVFLHSVHPYYLNIHKY